jgi:hypothetical protein
MKYLKLAWSVLLVYSVFHLLFSYQNAGVFENIIRMEGNLLILAVFNLMGLFPLAFLLYFLKYEKLPFSKNRIAGLILSFMTGAFALYPVCFNLSSEKHRKNNKKLNTLLYYSTIIFGFSSLILLIMGIFFGNFNHYIEMFSNDSLIHIMTLDFILLYALSIYVLKVKHFNVYYAMIPVFGFYLALFLHEKDHKS